ncbi:hypothetical protein [Mesorhizobium sp.]|uniref:hypothetical protein n=1 Tax=Mesorhizobium sp. TaxID=1871066 RepID=UPI00120CE999|nr:hypothetical protein [Mesorhizobium sp.]TIV56939.1 MAG: hypothetical protein E5V80_24810 [Mesorhizobium sp.]
MNDTKVVDGLQQWPAGRSRAEIEAGEQTRRVGDLPTVFPEFGKIGMVVRLGECADTLDSGIKCLPVDQVEDRGAESIVGRFGIEDNDRRVVATLIWPAWRPRTPPRPLML